MRPIDFVGKDDIGYGAPKNWDEAKNGVCHTLPVKRENGNIISVWRPSAEERKRIAAGQNVVLSCYTVQPPVTLTVAAIYEENDIALGAATYSDALGNLHSHPRPFFFESIYRDKCKRLRMDGPTPCLCCPGECTGDEDEPNPALHELLTKPSPWDPSPWGVRLYLRWQRFKTLLRETCQIAKPGA